MSVSRQGLRKQSRAESALVVYPNALIAHREFCGHYQHGIHTGTFATRRMLRRNTARYSVGVSDSPEPQGDLQGVYA